MKKYLRFPLFIITLLCLTSCLPEEIEPRVPHPLEAELTGSYEGIIRIMRRTWRFNEGVAEQDTMFEEIILNRPFYVRMRAQHFWSMSTQDTLGGEILIADHVLLDPYPGIWLAFRVDRDEHCPTYGPVVVPASWCDFYLDYMPGGYIQEMGDSLILHDSDPAEQDTAQGMYDSKLKQEVRAFMLERID